LDSKTPSAGGWVSSFTIVTGTYRNTWPRSLGRMQWRALAWLPGVGASIHDACRVICAGGGEAEQILERGSQHSYEICLLDYIAGL